MSKEPTYTAAEWARRIASRRELVDRACEKCGAQFHGIKTRKYCSPACRVAAHRARRGPPAKQEKP